MRTRLRPSEDFLMVATRRSVQFCRSALRAVVAGGLCVLSVEQPMAVASGGKKPVPAAQIQGDEAILHALNRFSFGPRPGDVAAVRAMGVRKWFEWQLNPMSIDDSALDQRLAMFPAMNLPQAELVQRYPSPQMLKQVIDGKMSLPVEPVEHAIYVDQIAFYQAAKAKKEAKQQDAAADAQKAAGDGMQTAATQGGGGDAEEMKGKAALPGDGVDPAVPAMATHMDQFYSGLDAVKIINLPPDQRMRRILAMPPAELIEFRRSLSKSELAAATEGLSPEQKEILIALQGSPRMVGEELLQSRLMRDIYSQRQLEAVMTDFWLDHFNVYIKKNQNEAFLLPAYERDVIRPNALGKFEDLLVATAKSPAMLMYLDNWQSIGPDSQAAKRSGKFAQLAANPQVKQGLKDRGLNENYARELMELHTLGVQCEVSQDHPVSSLDKVCGEGYTQQDVTQVAKVLTGWTIDQPFRGGAYQFEERRHEPGPKSVLGATIREGGEAEGLQVLHMLATSPATAKLISRQLAVRFVSDTPPPALVDRMAKAFVTSDGDIKTVLRAMFNSPEFWSPEVYRAKVKTPLEFVVSAVRAGNLEVSNAVPMAQALNKLGMPLYGMQTPNGYSWMAATWVNTGDLVSRMNFALALSGDHIAGAQTDWTGLLAQGTGLQATAVSADVSVDAAAKEKKLETLLLGQAVSDRTRTTVLQQLQDETTRQQAEKSFGVRANDSEPMAAVLNEAGTAEKPKPPQDRQAAVMAGLLLGSPEFQRR
jgi:uncharacterized protein (DUF1800 family)